MVNTSAARRFPRWWSTLPWQWHAGLFETPTQVLWSVGGWRQQAAWPGPRLQRLCTAAGWGRAGGRHCQGIQLTARLRPFSPLPARPWKGPAARGQGKRGRQPLPAKQTCSLHIHFIKTNVFLEFLLASCCLFLFGLTVSGRNSEEYGAFQDNSIPRWQGSPSDSEADSPAPLNRKWWIWKRSDDSVVFL